MWSVISNIKNQVIVFWCKEPIKHEITINHEIGEGWAILIISDIWLWHEFWHTYWIKPVPDIQQININF